MSEFRRSIHCLLPKCSDFRILSPIIFRILNIQSPLPNFIITTLPFKSFHHILNTRSVFSQTQNHTNHNTHFILVFGLLTKWQILPKTQPTITRFWARTQVKVSSLAISALPVELGLTDIVNHKIQ